MKSAEGLVAGDKRHLLIMVVIGAVLAGCSTPERSDRAAALSLSYHEFDQSYGAGFRALFDAGDAPGAASLLEEYLTTHHELTDSQRKFLHLHAGQMWAFAGKNKRAVKHLEAAMSHQKSPELWPDWNDTMIATKAFLLQDRAALLAARDRLAAANAPRLKLADRFIQKFGQSYADVIWWIPVCATVALPQETVPKQRAAGDRLAKALGCPLTIGETNSAACCIWLQVQPFSPMNGPRGYIIAHSADGTLISASNTEWLDDAVERFIKSIREGQGGLEAPYGLVSNFDPNPQANPKFRRNK